MQLGRLGPRGLGHPGLAAHVRRGPGGRRGAALAAPHSRHRTTQKFPPPVTLGLPLQTRRPPSPTGVGSSGQDLPPNYKGGQGTQTRSSRRGGPSWSHF